MKIKISDNNGLINDRSKETIINKVRSSFSRFGNMIGAIQIFFIDSNGPKGGVDKNVRINIALNRLKNVSVNAESSSLNKAVAQAINRAERVVARMIQKRHFTNRRNGTGLAYERDERGIFND